VLDFPHHSIPGERFAIKQLSRGCKLYPILICDFGWFLLAVPAFALQLCDLNLTLKVFDIQIYAICLGAYQILFGCNPQKQP
jgi:hypothetical protein